MSSWHIEYQPDRSEFGFQLSNAWVYGNSVEVMLPRVCDKLGGTRNSLRTHGAFFESWHVPVPALCSEIRGPNLLTGRLLNSILSLIHCCVSCRIWLGSSILFHEVFPL